MKSAVSCVGIGPFYKENVWAVLNARWRGAILIFVWNRSKCTEEAKETCMKCRLYGDLLFLFRVGIK